MIKDGAMEIFDDIPEFGFAGVPKIMIPCSDVDFRAKDYGKSVIEKYLQSVLNKHSLNRHKIDYFHRFALGKQDIANKVRLYNKDAKNNNKITENHAYRQVNFKVACLCGEKREYANKGEQKNSQEANDEIAYLDKYFTDVDFYSKDKNIKEWVYQTGVGVSYQNPRTDIIVATPNSVGQIEYKYDYDFENEAPFDFADLDPRDNFVVYSSIRGNEPLFCVSLVKVEKPNITTAVALDNIDFEYKMYIETRYARFIATCDMSFEGYSDLKFEIAKTFNSMPMVEFASNNARMGVVELNRDLFNCINTLVSNVIDMVVDGANIIMVFKNTDIDQETIDDLKNKGAIILNDNPMNKNNSEAKLDIIRVQIDFNGFASFYEERLAQAYDIAGVPLASGQSTNGGDTGHARMLGGGWENAYMVIRNDITTLLKSDYTVLKGLLEICKNIPSCPIKNISASEIDIKYHINQSDNLLTKAQSIAQLYQINMPKDEILKVTGLFSDIFSVAQKWESLDAETKAAEEEQGVHKNTDLVGGGDTGVARVT